MDVVQTTQVEVDKGLNDNRQSPFNVLMDFRLIYHLYMLEFLLFEMCMLI